MDYNVIFFVESCQLLFENKLSWIFYELISFHDNNKNYFADNLYWYNHKTHYKKINNHFPSLFDYNFLEKVDSNTSLVEAAPNAVDRRS